MAILVEGFAVLIQLLIDLVILILQALGFAVEHLAAKPKEGERRFTAQRILVAFAPLLLLVATVFGIWQYAEWSAKVTADRTQKTKALVEDHVERLVAKVDDYGKLVQHPADFLATEDAWGNRLRVEYEVNLVHESVKVCSDGADEKPKTSDDIASTRKIMRPKKEIAEGAFDKIKDAIRDRVKKGE